MYLYQTVKYRALDHLRHQEVKKRNEEQWTRETERAFIQFRDKDSGTLIRRVVSEAVAHLPARCRMAYTLHRKDGLTYEEIAQVMEVSVKTVESHITRALKRLRRELKTYDFDFLWIYKD